MKTLLINGCSFIAGDAIVWDKFSKENNYPTINWETSSPEFHDAYVKYRLEYRPQFNFSHHLADQMNCPNKVDLSSDGNSNDMIAISTIAFLLSKPIEERKKFHVCIGWTEVARLMKYSKTTNTYYNLHVNHYGLKSDNVAVELSNYIKYSIIEAYNQDYIMNYAKNVILLENFLKSNNITYTFFRGLGSPRDMPTPEFSEFSSLGGLMLSKDNISDQDNWYKFIDHNSTAELHPMCGISWCDSTIVVNKKRMTINDVNGHPNELAVTLFASDIAKFLKNKNVL